MSTCDYTVVSIHENDEIRLHVSTGNTQKCNAELYVNRLKMRDAVEKKSHNQLAWYMLNMKCQIQKKVQGGLEDGK